MFKIKKVMIILLIVSFILFNNIANSYGVNNNTSNESATGSVSSSASRTSNEDTNETKGIIINEEINKDEKNMYIKWFDSLEDYLKSLGLSEYNLKYIQTELPTDVSQSVTKKYYYIRYQGHVFEDTTYVIYVGENGSILKATYIDHKYEQILPKISAVENKYNELKAADLNKDLTDTMYNIFDHYNYFTSTDRLREFIKKCELKQEEMENQIDLITRMYDVYLEDRKYDEPIRKYTKKELLDIYNEIFLKDYVKEMARNNHIEYIREKVDPTPEEYNETFIQNMIQDDEINKTSVVSKKVVNEIPNSGSNENRYVIILNLMIVITAMTLLIFIIVGKTRKNSKK